MQRKQATLFLCFDLSRRGCRGAKNRAKQAWIREDQKFKYSVQWCWNLAAQLSQECFIWVNSGISDPIPEQDRQIVDTVFPGGTRAKFPVVESYPIVYRRFFFVEFKSWNLRPTQWTRDGVEETSALPDLNILRFLSPVTILLESNISYRSDAHRTFSILSHAQDKSGNHRYSSSPSADFDFSHSSNISKNRSFIRIRLFYFSWKSVWNWKGEYWI